MNSHRLRSLWERLKDRVLGPRCPVCGSRHGADRFSGILYDVCRLKAEVTLRIEEMQRQREEAPPPPPPPTEAELEAYMLAKARRFQMMYGAHNSARPPQF